MLRDATSLQVKKQKEAPQYQIQDVVGGTEVFPISTAENTTLLSCLLKLLKCIQKSMEKEDRGNQDNTTFWNAVKVSLMNTIQIPIEDKCYTYNVLLTNEAMKLLILLSGKQGAEQDVAKIDTIIARLSFELQNLLKEDENLLYPQPSTYPLLAINCFPKLQHRQELCNTLFSLITSSININNHRENDIEDENDELSIAWQRFRLQADEHIVNQRVGRDRQAEEARALQEARRHSQIRGGRVAEPEEEKEEDIPHGETVAVSRKIIESPMLKCSYRII